MEDSLHKTLEKDEYPTSRPSTHSEQPSYSNYDDMDNPYTPLLYAPTRRESPSSRFSTTCLSTILLLVIFNCFLTARSILSTYQARLATDAELAVITGDKIVECTRWKQTPDDASSLLSIPGSSFLSRESAEFELPIDAKGLFVAARGSLSSGIVRVHESPDVKDLKVSVFAHYRNRKALSRARVCLVKHQDGGNGVAILTPFRWIPPRKKDSLFFIVDVNFPSPKHNIQHVSSFAIDVPKFVLDVDDLSAYSFGAFALKSTNRPITVNSVTGDTIIADSKNGKIEGFFNATRLLKLSTTNNLINVSLNAHNNLPSKPTVVALKTSNGPLHSNISLSTNSSSGTGGHFRIHTHTRNAPLGVSFSASPSDSRLVLDASTRNAPAHVALHAAFEGGFVLQTSQFRPVLRELPGVEDPSGRGRERNVSARVVARCAVIGNVSWVSPDEHVQTHHAGWASVTTRNAPVTLVL